jgi:hypothetical protein
LQLIHNVPSLSKRKRGRLLRIIESLTLPASYDNDFFIKNVAQESYRDAGDVPELSSYMRYLVTLAGHPPGEPFDLRRLPGVSGNVFQLAGDKEVLNAADLLVRVAEANMEIVFADLSGGADLHVSTGTEIILRQKLIRSGGLTTLADSFAALLDLNGIPDIRVGIESGTVTMAELWKLRQNRGARQFRRWLVDAQPKTSRDLERKYVESLGRTSWVQALPARVVRFAVTAGLGVALPLTGLAASMADSFFVDRYLSGYRPKLMFDELRKLFPPKSVGTD